MDYPQKVRVVEFAQLALDVYEDPDANDVRPGFNQAWRKINSWTSPNQFHATFYKNMQTNVGVLAIRGTVPKIKLTMDADKEYFKAEFDEKPMPQFTDAIRFYIFLQTYSLWQETKEKYVTGHSLGGMLSKALAPITGLNTIAFNSPSMSKFLLDNHFCLCLQPGQKQVTYSSPKDFIGNVLSGTDSGKYISVEPDAKENTLKNELHALHFHSMKLLYTTIKNGTLKNDMF